MKKELCVKLVIYKNRGFVFKIKRHMTIKFEDVIGQKSKMTTMYIWLFRTQWTNDGCIIIRHSYKVQFCRK